MEQLGIQEKRAPNYNLLELSGEVTSYTFAEFEKMAYDLMDKNNLVLDLAEVNEIDSSGLSVILGSYNGAKNAGYTLFLLRPSRQVMEALEKTGFLSVFRRIYSVTEIA